MGMPEWKQPVGALRRFDFVDGRRPTGKDNAFGIERQYFFQRRIVRQDFAVHLALAHFTRDELRVLRPKIENDNSF
jgi:hypothetical protein